MGFQAGKGIREHADGVFETALRLVQHGLVVHDLGASGFILAGFQETLFREIEFTKLPVNLSQTQIHVGIVGHQVRELLVNLKRIGIFFLGEERLAQAAQMTQLGGVHVHGLAVGSLGLREVASLRVSIAEKIQQCRRRRAAVHSFEQRNSVGGLAFIEQKLG